MKVALTVVVGNKRLVLKPDPPMVLVNVEFENGPEDRDETMRFTMSDEPGAVPFKWPEGDDDDWDDDEEDE